MVLISMNGAALPPMKPLDIKNAQTNTRIIPNLFFSQNMVAML